MSLVVFERESNSIMTEFDDFTFAIALVRAIGKYGLEEATSLVHELPSINLTDDWLRDEGVVIRGEFCTRERVLKIAEKEWIVVGYGRADTEALARRINMLMR